MYEQKTRDTLVFEAPKGTMDYFDFYREGNRSLCEIRKLKIKRQSRSQPTSD